MANETEKVNTIAIADIEKISGKTDDNIEKISGLEFTGTPPDWKGSRAILMGGRFYDSGGSTASAVSVQYKTLASDANTSDFGDLAASKSDAAGSGSNGTTVVMGGGTTWGSPTVTNTQTIDYVTAASTGTFGDAGDLEVGSDRGGTNGASNGTLCFFAGGRGLTSNIEQMTISSTGGASDAGDLTASSITHATSNGDSKFLLIGIGSGETAKTAIDEHDFSTTGNASDYGNVATVGIGKTGVVCATNRVVTAGGYIGSGAYGTRLQFFPVASAADGDTSDEADLVVGAVGCQGTSNGTRGEFYGGEASSGNGFFQNDIQKVTISSLANTTDVGDLTTVDSATNVYSTGDASGIADMGSQTAIN